MTFLFLICVLGSIVFLNYPRKEEPTIIIRSALVTTNFPGMSVQRIEDLITRPVEEKIREIPEVKHITSSSKTGKSIITISLNEKVKDIDKVWQDLRDKITDLKPSLPKGTQGPFVNDDYGLTAIATIALTAEGYSFREMRDQSKTIRDQLYTLNGIKKVELYGIQNERIFIIVSNSKLKQLKITPQTIKSTLQAQNIILPGGMVNSGGLNFTLEPSGNFETIQGIGETLIQTENSTLIPLKDIAEIKKQYVSPPKSLIYYNGQAAIILSVSINDGIDSVKFGKQLTQKIDQLQNELTIGYQLDFATFQPDIVKKSVDDAVSNVYQTIVIVFVIVMLFLGIRSGLIVGMLVPSTMLLALIIMRMMNIEFQRMSIAAMIIALGLLVDNGIVITEDIRRRIEKGGTPFDSALKAGKNLSLPLLTSSLTTILAFLPMMLSVGAAGEYTRALSQVIIVVLLGSWFLALTIIPSLCYWFLGDVKKKKSPSKIDSYHQGIYKYYRSSLKFVLRFPLLTILASVIVFFLSLQVFKTVPKVFFPSSERNQFLIYVDLPAGSSIDQTNIIVQNLSKWLSDKKSNPDITSNIAYVAEGGPRFILSLDPINPDPHHGFLVATLNDVKTINKDMQHVQTYVEDYFPQARIKLKKIALGPGEAGLLEVRISGPDREYLYSKIRELEHKIKSIPDTINVENNWENKIFKAYVKIDPIRARLANVTNQEIAEALNGYLSGDYITDYRDFDVIIPIEWRGSDKERKNLESIQDINIYSQRNNQNIPLSQIADILPDQEFSIVKRRDQERTVTLSFKNKTLSATELSQKVTPLIQSLNLSPVYQWKWGGELENSSEAQAYLFEKMPYCFAAIIVLLIWQFSSYRRPIIIFLTIPLSFIGAFLGLKIMQASFGFMETLGLLSLAGIIINNGIVMIDRIDSIKQDSISIKETIIEAAITRLRPIIMTAVTTALGLLPLILFGGNLWYGLANVIAWGLAIGTLLTLYITPVLYSLFFPEKTKK